MEGLLVGLVVGIVVGDLEGEKLGTTVGLGVGAVVGDAVGGKTTDVGGSSRAIIPWGIFRHTEAPADGLYVPAGHFEQALGNLL